MWSLLAQHTRHLLTHAHLYDSKVFEAVEQSLLIGSNCAQLGRLFEDDLDDIGINVGRFQGEHELVNWHVEFVDDPRKVCGPGTPELETRIHNNTDTFTHPCVRASSRLPPVVLNR
jgi:hypothetical protein